MASRKHYYHSIQRQSRCKDHIYVLDTIRAAGMDETQGTYVDDEFLTFMNMMMILIMILMMVLTMILMMILMMKLMMVGAGTCIQSRIKDQGPCPGTNEHPRTASDVISRQSKAPIELLYSRSDPRLTCLK